MQRVAASMMMLALFTTPAVARICPDCPTTLIGGGGSSTNECVVQWIGIASDAPSCADGDATCDADATADGVCTFPLQACFAMEASCGATSVTSVKVGPSKVPQASTLQSAIGGLAAGGCAEVPVTVPVKRKTGAKPIKAGKTSLKVTTESEPGKDKDKLVLTCLPAAPSFAADIQPIFTARCATLGGCHDVQANGGLVMLEGEAYGDLVNAASASSKKDRVEPGKIPASLMARRLFGQDGAQMPSGCPNFPPPEGGCATDAEIYTILSWIQNGAPNN
jgi:hypothetical protein